MLSRQFSHPTLSAETERRVGFDLCAPNIYARVFGGMKSCHFPGPHLCCQSWMRAGLPPRFAPLLSRSWMRFELRLA